MALSFAQWVGSVIAEQVVAAPDPRLAALEQAVMTLTEAVAKLTPAVDAAVAKVADLASQNAAKDAQIADLQNQLATAQANAAAPADVQAVSDAADKLGTAVAPAPAEPPANP